MATRLRIFLLTRLRPVSTIRVVTVALAAVALSGCGLFGGKKEPPPLGSEVEKSQGPEANEQPVINPEVERRKIKETKVGSEDFEIGAYVGILSIEDFGSHAVYGARLDYHVTEDFFLEGTLGRSHGGKTSYEVLTPTVPLLTESQRDYTYGALNVGWDALPGEIFIGKNQAYNTAFYFTFGLGVTKFAGDNRFTANGGMGYRIAFARTLTAHFDFRDHLFDIDVLGQKKVAQNLEGSLGLSFFF